MANNSSAASASYNVRVVNAGTTTTNVVVTIALPQGLWPTWTGTRSTGNFGCTYVFAQATYRYTVTCSDSSMTAGADQTANLPLWIDQLATGAMAAPAVTVSSSGTNLPAAVSPVNINGVAVLDSPDSCPALLGTRGPNQFDNNGTFGTLTGTITVGSTGNPSNNGGGLPASRTTLTLDGTGQINDGEYRLANRVSSQVTQRDLAWNWTVGDHTTLGNPPGPSGPGNPNGLMMVINANLTPSVFYQQTLTVTPYTNYEFSAWSTHANDPAHSYWAGGANPPRPYNLAFAVNRIGVDDNGNGAVDEAGEQQVLTNSGNIAASAVPTWRQNAALFNTGAATQVVFIFRNNGSGGDGNDLALDDLLLAQCAGLPSANVSGTLYYDDNRNNTLDGTEAGRLPANISVDLVNSSGIVVAQDTTDADGQYLFQNIPVVPNANYTVRVLTTDTDIPANTTLGTPSPVAVTLVANATATVNFGFDRASITIVKNATPDSAQDFAFTTTGAGLSGFSLDDDADATLPSTITFGPLAPGARTVTEAVTAGWTLTQLVCSDPDNGTTVNLANRVANIDLDAGENITCTFINTQAQADLSITKQNQNPTGGTVASGSDTTYTIVVTNGGPSAVTGAVVADPAASRVGLTCPSPAGPATVSCTSAPAGACPQATYTMAQLSSGITLGALNNGATATFSFTCRVN